MIVRPEPLPLRIIDIKFHSGGTARSGGAPCAQSGGRRIISADTHIVKVWDASTGAGYTSIEPAEGQINDVCVWPDSGGWWLQVV